MSRFQPRFRAAERTERRVAKVSAPDICIFYFDHTDVLLGLIVGEGNGEVEQEPQHLGLKITQADQQIVSETLG